MRTAGQFKKSAAAMAAVMVTAGGAFAQYSADTAYVPFLVNVDAAITAAQGNDTVSMPVAANQEKILKLPLPKTTGLNTGGAQKTLNAPVITKSRENISLRLPPQSYQNAEVSLYSVNGRRILRGKADASNAVSGISRRNVAAGVYLLSAKGINGNVFTTRLTHSGGKMNISVAFGAENISKRLAKAAAAVAWGITVSAAGYDDSSYTLNIAAGQEYPLQVITLYTSGVCSGFKTGTQREHHGKMKKQFCDGRDGQKYVYVEIGNQTWMAEDLKYDVPNSITDRCYEDEPERCITYGRLYRAMSDVNTACPTGWRLPTITDWAALVQYAGGESTAAKKLRTATVWMDDIPQGTDDYGFSALPNGGGTINGTFYSAGILGWWWFDTPAVPSIVAMTDFVGYPYGTDYRTISPNSQSLSQILSSIRCIMDNTISVSFNINGGSGTAPNALTVVNQPENPGLRSITLPSGTGFTRSGHVFDGWNTNSSGTGATYTAGSTYTPAANITLYAKWNIVDTVRFNALGGGTTPNALTVIRGDSITLPAGITWSGYTFGGWNTTSSGTGATYAAGSSYTPPASSITLYAAWHLILSGITAFVDSRDNTAYNKFIIGAQTWMAENLNYDVPGNTMDVCYGNKADSCAKYGRLYDWSTANSACPVGWHLPSDAEWTTLTGYVGTNAGTKLKSSQYWNSYSGVPVGTDEYGFSALPGGRGYSGNSIDAGSHGLWWSATEYDASNAWNRNMGYSVASVSRGNSDKNYQYSVRCVKDVSDTVYTVTFNANGGTGTVPSRLTVVRGSSVTLPGGSNLSRSDYAFDWWNTKPDGTGTNYSAGSTYTPTGSVTLYVKWKQIAYVVSFDANGGSGTVPSLTADIGSNVTLPGGSNLSRSNYAFDGWNTKPDGTGTNYSAGSTYTSTANVTLYAKWYLAYTVTFNANYTGGTVSPTSGTTSANKTLATLPTPTRAGYTFKGWYTAATGGTQVTTATQFTASTTIYAGWEENNGTFVDDRDGKNTTYKWVKIGTQTWMAENLNYDVPNVTTDVCYENTAANCAKYGRLYDWSMAMGIAASYNTSSWDGSDVKHQGVCPVGWHLPSDAEWTALTDYVGGASTAGNKLKSRSGWQLNGTDDYGFAALPGGYGLSDGYFNYAGQYGRWWSATENDASDAWEWLMGWNTEGALKFNANKTTLYSVRCVQD